MADLAGNVHRQILKDIAHRVMLERGMLADFSEEAENQADAVFSAEVVMKEGIKDLTAMQWCSIDNDDSEDLDQLTTAVADGKGGTKVFIAVADVDSCVAKNSPIDMHAAANTLSVYTPAEIFPMLPMKLSTDITSLRLNAVRQAVIIEMTVDKEGLVVSGDVYSAYVKNMAKLAYNSTAAWLENSGPEPDALSTVKGLAENIRLQDGVAQKMRGLRYKNGALNFESTETHAVFTGGKVSGLEADRKNRAKELIEDFMIAANTVTAGFLESRRYPSIRRVVHTPKRWDRIVELAKAKGFDLPAVPDPKPLEKFLEAQKLADPLRFPDVSLSVIKLLGPGEYSLELPGASAEGHFGLAVKDYTHSTAPNRRFADLITHRLLKAAMTGAAAPYADAELDALAKHCTQKENDAKKVERQDWPNQPRRYCLRIK